MLTPEQLRHVADSLNGDTIGDREREFMCMCVEGLFPSERVEFSRLLEEHDVPMGGGLGIETCGFFSKYKEHAMPIRFMFLEFLALEAEGS